MPKTLPEMEARFTELEQLLQQPDAAKNGALYAQYLREHGSLVKVVTKYREWRNVQKQREEALEMSKKESDPELRVMAEEEAQSLKGQEDRVLLELQEMLISEDEGDQRNVIIEIRAGTGGEEACLFAEDLYVMYQKFAEKRHWKTEVLDSERSDLGGFREIIFSIKGKDAYKCMKYESGGHRVQRIPVTESGGRIHTSACTVAVLQEMEEVELEINPKDLKIEMIRASGPGGQNVNKTSSAVRITHIPTGIVVRCQDTPEQHKNKAKAMRILRTRLFDFMKEKQAQERNEQRRSQHGSGERSDRIRTYNFPQNRVTDHRINHSIYNLENVLLGELSEFVDKFTEFEREQRLQELGSLLPARS